MQHNSFTIIWRLQSIAPRQECRRDRIRLPASRRFILISVPELLLKGIASRTSLFDVALTGPLHFPFHLKMRVTVTLQIIDFTIYYIFPSHWNLRVVFVNFFSLEKVKMKRLPSLGKEKEVHWKIQKLHWVWKVNLSYSSGNTRNRFFRFIPTYRNTRKFYYKI